MTEIKKVNPGDALQIPADAYNAFVDAADRLGVAKTHFGRENKFDRVRSAGVVEVKNNSGKNVARLGVLGISEPIILPSQDLDTYRNKLRIEGVTPLASHVPVDFVVLLDPIEDGEIGFGVVAGATVAKVDVTTESHEFCTVEVGKTDSLASHSDDGARILWKESGTGVKECIIRFQSSHHIAVVKIDGSGCGDVAENASCLWSGVRLQASTDTSTMCTPFSVQEAVWIVLVNGCTDGTKLSASDQFVGFRLAKEFTFSASTRPLYAIEIEHGKVKVNKDDNRHDYLEDQFEDHLDAGTYTDGDLLCNLQTDVDDSDQLLRVYTNVTGYNSGVLQVLAHAGGSAQPIWQTAVAVEVVTDTRLVGSTLEKRRSLVQVVGTSDLGWNTAFPSTPCE